MTTDRTSFPAEAFRSDLPDGRRQGTLSIEEGGLRFIATSDEMSILLPLDGLTLRITGIHHEILNLAHPRHPELAIVSEALSLLDHPRLRQHPELAAQMAGAKVRHTRGRLVLPGCIALPILLLLLLWALADPIVSWIADRIPASVETELGDLLFKSLEGQMVSVEDDALERQLDELVAPLLAVVPNPGYRFELHLVDDPSLNAFALPGGHLVLHTGLVLAAETPEEILGVVGHELAHVTERHALRQTLSSAGLLVVFQSLFGDFSGLAAAATEGGYRLLVLKHSRRHELEADDEGWRLLIAARLDPRGMIRFFERLEEAMAALPGVAELDGSLNFLSTHPLTSERRERLLERWQELEGSQTFEPSRGDFAAFQRAIENRPIEDLQEE